VKHKYKEISCPNCGSKMKKRWDMDDHERSGKGVKTKKKKYMYRSKMHSMWFWFSPWVTI